MTEWLNQYERVAQRQQEYLQKIRDLRQRLRNRDGRYTMMSIEHLRNTPRDFEAALPVHKNPDYKSHVPRSSSLLAHSFYPQLSCPSPRSMAADPADRGSQSDRRAGGSYACVIAGKRLLPKQQHPKHLSPISVRHGKEKLSKSDMALERNKTDYEPIEIIAKRNRIQFSGYLTSGDDREERERKLETSGKAAKRPVETCDLSIVAHAGDVTQRDV